MQKIFFLIILLIGITVTSCHKKNYPSRADTSKVEKNIAEEDAEKKNASVAVKKPVVKKKTEPLPKVIAVNDEAAHKSVDGRLYYDVIGHRYWKNYKDGKYYLFNKAMFSDPAFKAPK